MISPIRADDTSLECTGNHTPMTEVCTKYMTATAKGAQVVHFISGRFTCLDVVAVHLNEPKRHLTANALVTVAVPDAFSEVVPYMLWWSMVWHGSALHFKGLDVEASKTDRPTVSEA